jgi:hypothetical protein
MSNKAVILKPQMTPFLIFYTPFRAFLMSELKRTLDISNLCIALLSNIKRILRVSNKCGGLLNFEAPKRTHLP